MKVKYLFILSLVLCSCVSKFEKQQKSQQKKYLALMNKDLIKVSFKRTFKDVDIDIIFQANYSMYVLNPLIRIKNISNNPVQFNWAADTVGYVIGKKTYILSKKIEYYPNVINPDKIGLISTSGWGFLPEKINKIKHFFIKVGFSNKYYFIPSKPNKMNK